MLTKMDAVFVPKSYSVFQWNQLPGKLSGGHFA